ncbi:hypothetical protein CAOG_000540 [Capsaspora owczarzaki ATCC 30864]|uniref:Uncharacterized protein n=2 Tax=Capsaspora owczarzaki (strain ATCC 30864) TaxID=595528 RepID=A0A0D2WHA7_CAPO3|nr:hypothetical protein CAOG_000540 [Capsaspora owczarzaki ATCC 30864]
MPVSQSSAPLGNAFSTYRSTDEVSTPGSSRRSSIVSELADGAHHHHSHPLQLLHQLQQQAASLSQHTNTHDDVDQLALAALWSDFGLENERLGEQADAGSMTSAAPHGGNTATISMSASTATTSSSLASQSGLLHTLAEEDDLNLASLASANRMSLDSFKELAPEATPISSSSSVAAHDHSFSSSASLARLHAANSASSPIAAHSVVVAPNANSNLATTLGNSGIGSNTHTHTFEALQDRYELLSTPLLLDSTTTATSEQQQDESSPITSLQDGVKRVRLSADEDFLRGVAATFNVANEQSHFSFGMLDEDLGGPERSH